MSYNYTRLQATATRLIDRFGRDATLHRAGTPTGPGYNQTPGTPEQFAVRVVDTNEEIKAAKGSLIERHARKLYLKGSGVVPQESDEVEMDSQRYAVISVLPLSPGGVPLMFEVEIKR